MFSMGGIQQNRRWFLIQSKPWRWRKKARKRRTGKSADEVILDVLVWERASDDPKEAKRKIRRRLRYYGLGPYPREHMDLLLGKELEIGRDKQRVEVAPERKFDQAKNLKEPPGLP
jgi:hypothetical protein